MFDNNVLEQEENSEFPWLTFRIRDKLYTINSKNVTSIISLSDKITKVPNLPEYMLGLIHLRGNVIPLIDLRLLISLDLNNKIDKSKNYHAVDNEMVIVLEENKSFAGLVIDEVLSVEKITPYEETAESRKIYKDNYIHGVARSEKYNDVLFILDEEKIMNIESK